MRRFFHQLLVLSILGVISSCNRDKPAEEIFTVERLSFSQNPSSVWEIGYTIDSFLKIADFRRSDYSDNAPQIALWHPSSDVAGYYPYTGQNRSAELQIDKSGRWALRGFQIAMEGSNTGQFSMLRFKPPAAGSYRIKVIFEGVHIGLSTTDVHVLKNDLAIFNDYIEGYGGDQRYNPITGNRPSCSYEDTLQLGPGDLITFAVGYGSNKNHYNDTTGLIITIEKV